MSEASALSQPELFSQPEVMVEAVEEADEVEDLGQPVHHLVHATSAASTPIPIRVGAIVFGSRRTAAHGHWRRSGKSSPSKTRRTRRRARRTSGDVTHGPRG